MARLELQPPQELFAVYVEVFREGYSLQRQFKYYQFEHNVIAALRQMAIMRDSRDREAPLAIWHLDLESEEAGCWVPYKFEIEVTLKPDPKGPA